MKYFITHTDFDGFGCYVYYKLYLENLGWKYLSINYNELTLKSRLQQDLLKDGEIFYFADMTPSDDFIGALRDDQLIYICDHHQEACEKIVERGKANIKVFIPSDWNAECGTSLLFLLQPYIQELTNSVLDVQIVSDWNWFINLVRTYDLWQDESKDWRYAISLQRCWVLFPEIWEKDIQNFDKTHLKWYTSLKSRAGSNMNFNRWELTVASELQEKLMRLVEEVKSRILYKIDKDGNSYATFGCSSMISLVCSEILKDNPSLKYVLCVNTYTKAFGKVSARSKEDRNFDCRTLPGFAGHKLAAGADLGLEVASLLK